MESYNWLGDLHLFVAVARAKSFTRAAAALDMPKSTLSRRVAELEMEIGLRLLNRTTRQVELTEDGANYLVRAERIVEDARMAHEDLRDRAGRPVGLLKVSMPDSIAWQLAMPWLSEFASLFPEVTIEIDTGPDHIDPIADSFDICIHENPPRNSSLIVRSLATLSRTLFASSGYATNYGLPSHPYDLAEHRCICTGMRESGRENWTLTRGAERLSVGVSGRITSVALELGPLLAREGMGIAAGVTRWYAPDVAQGVLVNVLPDWQFEPLVIYAIMPARRVPARTRAFLEFYAEKMKALEQQFG